MGSPVYVHESRGTHPTRTTPAVHGPIVPTVPTVQGHRHPHSTAADESESPQSQRWDDTAATMDDSMALIADAAELLADLDSSMQFDNSQQTPATTATTSNHGMAPPQQVQATAPADKGRPLDIDFISGIIPSGQRALLGLEPENNYSRTTTTLADGVRHGVNHNPNPNPNPNPNLNPNPASTSQNHTGQAAVMTHGSSSNALCSDPHEVTDTVNHGAAAAFTTHDDRNATDDHNDTDDDDDDDNDDDDDDDDAGPMSSGCSDADLFKSTPQPVVRHANPTERHAGVGEIRVHGNANNATISSPLSSSTVPSLRASTSTMVCAQASSAMVPQSSSSSLPREQPMPAPASPSGATESPRRLQTAWIRARSPRKAPSFHPSGSMHGASDGPVRIPLANRDTNGLDSPSQRSTPSSSGTSSSHNLLSQGSATPLSGASCHLSSGSSGHGLGSIGWSTSSGEDTTLSLTETRKRSHGRARDSVTTTSPGRHMRMRRSEDISDGGATGVESSRVHAVPPGAIVRGPPLTALGHMCRQFFWP